MKGINAGELGFDEKREPGRIADEGSESSQVKPAHGPVVPFLEDRQLFDKEALCHMQVVHEKPGGDEGDQDEGNPNERGVLEP